MFNILKKKNDSHNEQNIEKIEAGPPSISEEQLVIALNDIAQGKYNSFKCSDKYFHSILSTFTNKLETFQRESLDNLVNLSINISESVISGAEINKATVDTGSHAESMASATQKFSTSIKEIAEKTTDVDNESSSLNQLSQKNMEISNTVSEEMKNVAQSVLKTTEHLESLINAAAEITSMVGFISDIADQTNLLALNATIEAARAGDAGKGFAVVAHEVKELASKTSENAQQIADNVKMLQHEIENIGETTQNVTKAAKSSEEIIGTSNQCMHEILALSSTINGKTQDIAKTLEEQEVAAGNIAQGVVSIADMTKSNISCIDKTLDSMENMEKKLINELNILSKLEIKNITVYLAKSDHIIWKKRLANMLVGRESLSPNELTDHHSCRLGRWYDSINENCYTNNPAYNELLDPHQRVHSHGIEAAKKYNNGDFEGAIKEVKEVENSSTEVLHLLDKLIASS